MEMGLSRVEKSSDQLILWSCDHGRGLGHGARSYTCSFCKRGFSNAQALGGHMNIHRRDRAKLKGGNDLSLDTIKKKVRYQSLEHDEPPWQSPESSDESYYCTSTPKRLCREFDDLDTAGDAAKLDAFEDDQLQLTLSSSTTQQKGERNSPVAGGHVMQLLTHDGASQRELDLELRLGPEPHDQEEATKK